MSLIDKSPLRTVGGAPARFGWNRVWFIALAVAVLGHNFVSWFRHDTVSQLPIVWGLAPLLIGGALFFLQARLAPLFRRLPAGERFSAPVAGAIVVLAVGVLLAASFLVKKFDMAGDGFVLEGGAPLFAYNASRCFFILAFIAMCLGAGAVLNKCVALLPGNRENREGLNPGAIALFFIGAASLGLVLFFLGLAGGYQYWTVMAILLPFYAIGILRLGIELKRVAGAYFRRVEQVSGNRRLAENLAFALILVLALFLLLLKGLFPANDDSDVWTHYMHYFRATVESGAIAPNDLWYHFWCSKGASLFFVMILISDHLAPQLVSYAVILFAASAVYSLTRRLLSNRVFSLLAAAVFLGIYLDADGWGYFFKSHEVLAALVLGAIHLLVREKTRFERLGLCIIVSYITLLYPTFTAIIVGGLGIAAAWALVARRPRREILNMIGLGTVSVATLAVLLSYNYNRTGLALETPLRIFWEHADQEKFSQFYSPHLVQYLLEGTSDDSATVTLHNLLTGDLSFYARIFRLEDLPGTSAIPLPIVGAAFLSGFVLLVARFRREKHGKNPLILALLSLSLVALSVASAANQPISVYRLYSFLTFIPVVVLSYFFYRVILAVYRRSRLAFLPNRFTWAVTMVILAAAMAVHLGTSGAEAIRTSFALQSSDELRKRNLDVLLEYAFGLLSPRLAIDHAGLHNEILYALRKEAGLQNKVVNLGLANLPISSYPGVGLAGAVSYAMGRNWHEIAFEDAETAMARLKEAGCNYFIIDFQNPVWGSLPFSPLFSTSNRWLHFDVLRVEGTTVLLTWRTGSGQVDSELIELWDLKKNGNFGVGYFDLPGEIREKVEAGERALPGAGANRQEQLRRLIRNTYAARIGRTFELEANVQFTDAILARFDELLATADLDGSDPPVDAIARQTFVVAFQETWESRFSKGIFGGHSSLRDWLLCDTATPISKGLYGVSRRIYLENSGSYPIFRNPDIPRVKGWQ